MLDLTDLDMWARGVPYQEFARLRRDTPVAWFEEEAPNSGFWSVHGYADIVAASRDVATFSSARGVSFEEPTDADMAARTTIIDLDPPDHTKLRKIVFGPFTQRAIAAYQDFIEGLTDYLALSGELRNSSDVEVLVNGTSVGSRHFNAADSFSPPWQIHIPAATAGGSGLVVIRKSGDGITYWSAESQWYSADKSLSQQGKVALNITRDYYLLQKNQPKPTDPITYDLVPLKGQVHVGDIVAVRLALSGAEWKYLLAEDPIPSGTEFLEHTELYTLNDKPDWWADWFTRKEFHDDRAAFFDTEFNGRREFVYLLKVVNPGRFAISPAQAGPMYQPQVQTTSDPATLEVQP